MSTLAEQLAEAQRDLVNHQEHVRRISELARKGKYSTPETEMQAARLPAKRAIVETLTSLLKGEVA